jgi:DNA mismatch repair protein MutL
MTTRRVQILPEHIANKIAAGEVIQRPESVVKELLENSLDAGAKNVEIIIKDGGKQLVQVVDDGIGMDQQDAMESFLRHATSKIATYEDLEDIRTFGFRGEALASVAAVAQVTMKTRRAEDDAAVVVQIDGGGAPRVSREGRERGTSLVVRNLFYNVPARRKFLKGSNTEFRHVYDAVQRVALSYPETGLRFISDDDVILDLKPGALQERILDVFGARQVEGMIWVQEKSDLLGVYGFIGKPAFGQKSRVNQFLFLNRRYIVNRNINHAVFSAYEHLLIKGTYPFFLLFIDIDPRRVDVNVHPSKLEAKFEDEQTIYRFVSTLVKKSLATHDFVPAASILEQGIEEGTVGLRFTNRQHQWPGGFSGEFGFKGTVDTTTGEILAPPSAKGSGAEIAERLLGSIEERFAASPTTTQVPPESIGDATTKTPIWQLHNKYILAHVGSGLMILDQHVAHERVLYERAVARFQSGTPASQQLLFPHTIELAAGDHALLMELLPHFEQLGFVIKPFGKNTVVVEGVPPDVRAGQSTRIVEDLLSLYKEYQQHSPLEVRDNLAKSFSCKAAIKAGDKLNEPEMRSLIDQLFSTKMPYVCPHGRPVVLKISIDELDRRFGRT